MLLWTLIVCPSECTVVLKIGHKHMCLIDNIKYDCDKNFTPLYDVWNMNEQHILGYYGMVLFTNCDSSIKPW